jgi:NAD(P)-dependent dehydrogenase (short-subunit alcohol dehydrogenase family)
VDGVVMDDVFVDCAHLLFKQGAQMQIGIIGLGAMGREIARNLVAAGHSVTAWNRSGGSVEGVRMAETPVHALQADMALTMLSDDLAIREVLLDTNLLSQARSGVVHVVSSTISVAFARELMEIHRAAGAIARQASPKCRRQYSGGRMSPPGANSTCSWQARPPRWKK